MKNRFHIIFLLIASAGCDPEACPDKPAEIVDPNAVICTSYNTRAGHGNVGATCDPKYAVNAQCCYGLNCSAEGKCVVGTQGRIGASCESRGDCMSSLACNADHKCVEENIDTECLAKQRD